MAPHETDQALEDPDWLLGSVLRLHLALTRGVVPYGRLLKAWTGTGRKSKDFTPVYTLGWLFLLVVAYGLSPLWVRADWAIALALIVVLWRYLDLVLWYLGLLINPRHTRFAPVERNVVLLIFDLLTVVFIAAALLRATNGEYSIDAAWFDGFFLATLTEVPQRLDFWDGVAQAAALFGGLLLIVGGLALILSVVSKRLSSAGPHVGPSHARRD